MKFQFNLTTQTLKIVKADRFLMLSKENPVFRKLGGLGFILDCSEPPNHWITFSVQKEKVLVVYKNSGTYFQRELTRPTSGIIEVEFSEWDRMEKKSSRNNRNKKNEPSSKIPY